MKTYIHEYHDNGVLKECWICPKTFKHRHETEEDANKCIAKYSNYYKPQNSWTKEKLSELLATWRAGGITKKALGAKYGVTGHHIALIIRRAEKLDKEKNNN